jgi:hypothetical protein
MCWAVVFCTVLVDDEADSLNKNSHLNFLWDNRICHGDITVSPFPTQSNELII